MDENPRRHEQVSCFLERAQKCDQIFQLCFEIFIFEAFLEKMNFTQPALMNNFYYFFQGEEYFAHRL